MAEQIGEKLALCGAEVLSGMARGIDAYGHIGALKAGGNTYAVLGVRRKCLLSQNESEIV